MPTRELDFLVSALALHNTVDRGSSFKEWFHSRRQAHQFGIRRVPFEEMQDWSFEPSTGNLVHASGKFFSIEGISVSTNFGPVPQWSQPIIVQLEVGILGILTRKFNGVLHFLMQAKMEPGNVNVVQLAPTVQATRSNFTCVHGGKSPPYLEYFLDETRAAVLVDVLQSEQGARFLHKRNRNMIVKALEDVPLLDDFCWLTLAQIRQLARYDNIVNMDARTVLSCIPLCAAEVQGVPAQGLSSALAKIAGIDAHMIQCSPVGLPADILSVLQNADCCLHEPGAIQSWFSDLKARFELNVERIALRSVDNWHRTGREILCDEDKYFTIIALQVEASNREIPRWFQPIVEPCQQGIVAYLMKRIRGVPHLLVQAKVEPGNLDVVEMAPTVQCITGSYSDACPGQRPPFLDYVLRAPVEQIRYSTLQSEEGGRFFQEQNRNMIIEVGDDFPLAVPDNYIWVAERQLGQLIEFNNCVNVEGRCLLSCLGCVELNPGS